MQGQRRIRCCLCCYARSFKFVSSGFRISSSPSLVSYHPNQANGAAVVIGTGVADGDYLLDVVLLDEAVDRRVEVFEFLFGLKYFQGTGECFDFNHGMTSFAYI